MANGIKEFYQTATEYGFARKNLFRISQITNDIYTPDQSTNLFLYTQDGIVPNRNITVASVDFKAFSFNIPMKAEYPEARGGWTATLMCDRDYVLRDIMEKWSVQTFDEHSFTSSVPEFWNCDVELSLLKNSGRSNDDVATDLEAIKKYTLKGAFPTSIGAMNYSTNDNGTIVTMPINLGFQYVISETLT